jgi:hypothetical protein
MGACGRDKKEDKIDPAVGVIQPRSAIKSRPACRRSTTPGRSADEAADMEDAFRISSQKPDERELILEVVG